MLEIRKIEKQWIENFKKSPLVKTEQGKFNSSWASQVYYGRGEEFPKEYPENFRRLYSDCDEIEINEIAEQLAEFLNFIGISVTMEQLSNHFSETPSNKDTALKKANYIFKMLAHQTDDFDFNNPYRDNNGDLLYFLRIVMGGLSGQLSIFDTLDLPELYNKYVNIPDGYENDKSVIELFNKIETTNRSFFITGKAGTGKSTFIHYFAQKTNKKVLITSFTGIAAINIGGVTIHSFFKFPLKPLLPNDHEIPVFKDYYQARRIIQGIDVIIIDEVSMLRSDLLEAIDYSLRKNGGNENQLFGGKQLLLFGDIFQLPPVTDTEDEVENFLFSEVYKSEYFFSSPSFQMLNPNYVELKKVHRQKDDFDFIELLDKVRLCEVDDTVIDKLNQRHRPDFISCINDFSITLTSNNNLANSINSSRLAELPFTKFDFEAIIEGEFRKDKYPTLKMLSLKKNSQVLFVKNDSKTNGRRWVNGTIAKIDFISHDIIEVRLQNGEVHKIEKETWENRKYEYDREKKKIVSNVIGTFQQFPLKPAWAITIHKSQGLTFDNVIIDLGSGAFVNGQVYTALSRCKTLHGITLKRKLRKEDVIADSRILNFHKANSKLSILDILKSNTEFTIKIISLYYPLSLKELNCYWDILEKGDAHYSVFLPDTGFIYSPKFGLCFNKNILWTDELKQKWQWGFNNSFNGNIEGTGGMPIEFDNYEKLKDIIPLSIIEEIKIRNNCIIEHWSSVLAPNEDWENAENFIGPNTIEEEKFQSEISKMGFDEFKNLYEMDREQILFNQSIWENTLKEILTAEVINEILNQEKNKSR